MRTIPLLIVIALIHNFLIKNIDFIVFCSNMLCHFDYQKSFNFDYFHFLKSLTISFGVFNIFSTDFSFLSPKVFSVLTMIWCINSHWSEGLERSSIILFKLYIMWIFSSKCKLTLCKRLKKLKKFLFLNSSFQ